jgi:hypothetical protein
LCFSLYNIGDQKNNNILGKEGGGNFGIVLPLLQKEMFQTQEGNKKKKKLLNLGFSHPKSFLNSTPMMEFY